MRNPLNRLSTVKGKILLTEPGKQARLGNVQDPIDDDDAVNKRFLGSYVASTISTTINSTLVRSVTKAELDALVTAATAAPGIVYRVTDPATDAPIYYRFMNSTYTVVHIWNRYTNEPMILIPTTTWSNGTVLNAGNEATYIDNVLYIKLGTVVSGSYYRVDLSGKENINANWYGCLPNNGSTDASVGANKAVRIATREGKDCHFPAGRDQAPYVFQSIPTSIEQGGGTSFMYVDHGGTKRIKIYGDKGTRFTTALTNCSFINLYNNCRNCTIEDIIFENTHTGSTTSLSNAITTTGFTYAIKNLTIQGCEFYGFSQAISGVGIDGFKILYNKFSCPRGHDDARDDTTPAVHINLQDVANGVCKNVLIHGNIASGYTGTNGIITDAPNTKRALDGFIIAVVAGSFTYTENFTENFNEEHIIISFKNNTGGGVLDKPVKISDNTFDGVIPTGALASNEIDLKKSCILIRSDYYNTVIEDNQMDNVTTGILIRNSDQPTLKGRDHTIKGNKMRSATDAAYTFQYMINVTGQNTNTLRAERIVVSNNEMYIHNVTLAANSAAIEFHDDEKIICEDNNIWFGTVTLGGFTCHGILLDRIDTGGAYLDSNNINASPSGDYNITNPLAGGYVDFGEEIKTIPVSAADIILLGAGKQLLPAPGTGFTYNVTDVFTSMKFAGAAYAGAGTESLTVTFTGAPNIFTEASPIIQRTADGSFPMVKRTTIGSSTNYYPTNTALVLITDDTVNPTNAGGTATGTLMVRVTFKRVYIY